jgi:DNA repair protein RadA/Sms
MSKQKINYQCTDCGHGQTKWAGQCAGCGVWNTLQEVAQVSQGKGRYSGFAGVAVDSPIVSLAAVSAEHIERSPTGLSEFDRVLGGGLVSGSAILIGGDPGIGKSTLLLQGMAMLGSGARPLYVTGEESIEQVSMRAQRLKLKVDHIDILAETSLEKILQQAAKHQPSVLVIDSIQTVYSETMQSAPGSVSQVRECAAQLVRFAKLSQTSVFLVGHVTKEGAIAGPRVLEHMVDTVLYFEGDAGSRFRVVRAIKNRFGAVNELGVFVMTELGLKEVHNPSAIFLSRHDKAVSGSVVMVTREGSRPLLVEVQTLVDTSYGGQPKRVTLGIEQNRLSMLLAVLHRHGGISIADQDVFVNIVGGMRLTETAGDLPVLASLLSSFRDRPVPNDWILFGEIGLAGEVRPVPNGEERLREAVKHGYKQAIIPASNAPKKGVPGLDIHQVKTLSDALELL